MDIQCKYEEVQRQEGAGLEDMKGEGLWTRGLL